MPEAKPIGASAEAIAELARGLGQSIDEGAARSLASLVASTDRWNRRLNLSGARTATALLEIVCADAIVLSSMLEELAPCRFIDVGSGGGAPALAFLLLDRGRHGILVEPLQKRVAFLRSAIGELGLGDRARVLNEKLSVDRAMATGPFELAISRATFAPHEWLSLGVRLAPRVAVFTASESPPPAPLGFACAARRDYRLPHSGSPRTLVVYGVTAEAAGDECD